MHSQQKIAYNLVICISEQELLLAEISPVLLPEV